MITTNSTYNSPVRKINAKVELYSSSTLSATYKDDDRIKGIEISRIGEENKFFGFGITQRLNLKLIDVERELSFTTSDFLAVSIGENEYIGFPNFYITEVNRDENTNELSITAYDALNATREHTVSELNLSAPYTIGGFVEACATLIGVEVAGIDGDEFDTSYPAGANFEGTETIRSALTMAAEATQTVFYMGADNVLHFKRLNEQEVALTITKDAYFTLKSGDNRRLQTICSATELGDDVSESTTQIGSTQYVRDNAFWELREDIAALVSASLERVGNMTFHEFSCQWRGHLGLECGDKIAIVAKDDTVFYTYLTNDTLTYTGALSEKTEWAFVDDAETESNPTSIGDAIKQTYARVDKQNKEITLLASSVEGYDEKISQLQLTQNSISATVSSVVQNQTDLTNNLADLQDNINQQNQSNAEQFETLTKRVDATMTSDEINLAISTEVAKGADKVITSTGFKFDDDGLTISKSDSEMTTNIDEDGMSIFRNNEEVLTADNTGVNAKNLHATTYLIIGTNSRFENYGSDRTGCFWIGN